MPKKKRKLSEDGRMRALISDDVRWAAALGDERERRAAIGWLERTVQSIADQLAHPTRAASAPEWRSRAVGMQKFCAKRLAEAQAVDATAGRLRDHDGVREALLDLAAAVEDYEIGLIGRAELTAQLTRITVPDDGHERTLRELLVLDAVNAHRAA